MKQVRIIIAREFLSRVRKKSFLVMTLLGPLLLVGFYAALILVAVSEEAQEYNVLVFDETPDQMSLELQALTKEGKLGDVHYHFDAAPQLGANRDRMYADEKIDAILVLPLRAFQNPSGIYLGYKTRPGLETRSNVSNAVEKVLEDRKLAFYDIPRATFDEIRKRINIPANKLNEAGEREQDDTMLLTGLGVASGFLIYFFIFMYGVMVMRGVMEEKTSRIVEVIVSSVRPYQLMLGKIVGVALVGLTQFLIWVILSGIAFTVLGALFAPDVMEQAQSGNLESRAEVAGLNAGETLSLLASVNWFTLIGTFIFYFLGGYLLYSSLFAAIGAAVDAESDTQQFMLPVTLPLIFSIVLAMNIIKNPHGAVAGIFSIVPFTSPVVMMSRVPFNPDLWQVILSMALLVLTFLGTTWLAARIYRIGILSYGKKVNYKDLGKWLFQKNL